MSYRPFLFPGFAGGLNLRDQPDQVGESQAIDCLNVTFSERGALKMRSGYANFAAVAGPNRYDSLTPFYRTSAPPQLVAGAGNRLEALNVAGALVAAIATAAAPHYFAHFGGPSGEYVFAANGSDQLRRWDGSGWTTPAWSGGGAAPTGNFVAVTPWDNRLVNARRAGTAAGDNVSSVRFSNPGNPTVWAANDYDDLVPGDGEPIMGICTWGGYVFVFKRSKFFVYYGTSTDATTGNAIFNYRPVDTGVGLAASRALAVAPEGVYLLSDRGVYMTNGGAPRYVADLVKPFFVGGAPDYFRSDLLNAAAIGAAAMGIHEDRIAIAVPTGSLTTNNRVLVYDTRIGWWTIYDLPIAALTTWNPGDHTDLFFACSSGANQIGRFSRNYTADAGQAITARWRSGWFDFGSTFQKTLRETKLWGKGKFLYGVSTDFLSNAEFDQADLARISDTWGDGTGADTWGGGSGPDTWGEGLGLNPLVLRRSSHGTVFSLGVRDYSGAAFSVNRLAHHVREARIPSVVS